ncbi:MAG: hypothetical protein EYC62_08300 [Alphaproteobacteria bacterium]|nr:MAG: hypothetical protein EYC62_08300 [Alphaproteobacteria bacterium]
MTSAPTGLVEPSTATVAVTFAPLVYGHVPTFLEALEKALYDDARDLYENRTPPTRTRNLLDPAKLSVDFLKQALDIITPTKGADPQNPTLFYLLDDLHTKRTAKPKSAPIVRVPCATSTKQMEWLELRSNPIQETRIPDRDIIDNTIGGLYTAMYVVGEVPPCTNPGAGPIAKAGKPGYELSTGNFHGLLTVFVARQRGGSY